MLLRASHTDFPLISDVKATKQSSVRVGAQGWVNWLRFRVGVGTARPAPAPRPVEWAWA